METIKFLPLCEEFTLPEYSTSGSANFDLRAHFSSKLNGSEVLTVITNRGASFYGQPVNNSKEVFGVDFITLNPGEWAIIPLGFAVELPADKKLEVYSRSGLSAKYAISILNSPGQIDSDYRGCVCAIIQNRGYEPFDIKEGDRICQGAIVDVIKPDFELVENLSNTERGSGGFGHSGVR